MDDETNKIIERAVIHGEWKSLAAYMELTGIGPEKVATQVKRNQEKHLDEIRKMAGNHKWEEILAYYKVFGIIPAMEAFRKLIPLNDT